MFFSPFANIWEHTFPEALVAESFSQQSIEVSYLRCNGMLQEHCVAMSAAGVGPEASLRTRQQVCTACVKRRDLVTRELGLPADILDTWIDDEIRERVERTIAELPRDGWTKLEIDGIPLGRYAAYEAWINNKLVDDNLDDRVWAIYLGQLRNTLLTYWASVRVLAVEKPDVVIVYNDHYGVNHAFCAAARRAGIASYTIHGGHHMVRRGETLSILSSDHTMEDIFRSSAWKAYESQPIGAAEVDLVGTHLTGLFAANSAFAYSSELRGTGSDELRSRLGVAPGASVLLAPMSSEDELFGLRLIDAVPRTLVDHSLFADQFDWVNYLFTYARAHPDKHLVLRLHPRMFPNKRESVLSPIVSRVMALRADAPRNVTFNMPDDGIGLYDLMQIVDVLLNFRSSVGAELSSVGIPVVVPANSDFYTYPGGINRVGHSLEEYSAAIDAALAEGWSLENSRRAFRWFAFLFGRFAVDFSDAVSARPIAVRPKKPGLRLWLWRKFVYAFLQYGPMIRERLALRNRQLSPHSREIFRDVVTKRLKSASDSTEWPAIPHSVDDETALLGAYLLELCDTIWAGVTEPDSLAGRIRSHLRVPAGSA
jgi:hypothetical protein